MPCQLEAADPDKDERVIRRQLTRPVAAADYWGKSGVRRFVGKDVFNAVLIDRVPKPETALSSGEWFGEMSYIGG